MHSRSSVENIKQDPFTLEKTQNQVLATNARPAYPPQFFRPQYDKAVSREFNILILRSLKINVYASQEHRFRMGASVDVRKVIDSSLISSTKTATEKHFLLISYCGMTVPLNRSTFRAGRQSIVPNFKKELLLFR